MRYIVALTGGIGSGKSTAAAMFGGLGADLIDTDAIAQALTAPGGAAIEPIRAVFGTAMIDASGAMDRDAMRRKVFADAASRKRLEAILHPMIRAEADARCMISTAPYIVLVVPLLVETGFYLGLLDRVAVVDCAESTQIRRTMARSRLSEAQVRAIMASQASREQRLAAADDVIDNDGDLAGLRHRIEQLHHEYLGYAIRGAQPA
jgi:dephospho-CoA kinase